MTFLFCRSVSLCLYLCGAVLCLCLVESHVGGTKPQEEAKRPEPPQDSCLAKGYDQVIRNEKLEATQSFSDNEHLKVEVEDETKDEPKDKREQHKPILDSEVSVLETNVSHMLQDQDSSGTTETDFSLGSRDPEDIPTFDEWKRKVMMAVEKEKTVITHTSTDGAAHPVKKVQKNYASVECGAKILGANPEAKGTSSILEENMDLYMLNSCSNKIWFVIELCEPVQLKQLDIANFELFSSNPKDFLVSISDRYPTNKWLKLGTVHARDERSVQSFLLDGHLYAKYVKMFTMYIKVELVSYFGSEHFCPLSLIRVFGTSMVEEYEEIADPSERPEEQDDDLGMEDLTEEPTNGTESVFMRLNNQIKALEMNMSLIQRYLELLSQKYRKQMEEIKKDFDNIFIKLQNTSRVAEEQNLHHRVVRWSHSQGQRLHRIVRSAEKVIGCRLPSLQDLYVSRALGRAGRITADPSHVQGVFQKQVVFLKQSPDDYK